MLTSTNRLHTALVGSAPKVKFPVNPAVREPPSSMATAGIWHAKLLVPFPLEPLRNLRFAPPSIIIALLNAYPFIQGPSSQYLWQLHSFLPLLLVAELLHDDILGRAHQFRALRSPSRCGRRLSYSSPLRNPGNTPRLVCIGSLRTFQLGLIERGGGPVGKGEYHSSPKSTVDVTKYKIIGDWKVKRETNIMRPCSEVDYLEPGRILSYIYVRVACVSTVRFFESHLPYNAIIANHDER